MKWLLLSVILFLLLYLAYRIGTVILRVLAGLAFLGLVFYVIRHFFLR